MASNAAGVLVVLLVLRDIVHELFHPSGTGSLSNSVRRALWRVFNVAARRRRGVLAMAGPTMLLTAVLTWAALLALGWALVFLPYMPEQFRFASPLRPASQGGFADALYFSLITLTTLGFGDITPTQPLLRLLATVEAGIGFALLTAGISWILSIYPVLGRRRTLARRVFLVRSGEERALCKLAELEPCVAAAVLGELAAALAHAHVDLIQSVISYYFVDSDRHVALAVVLPYVAQLADEASAPDRAPAVRHAAAMLHEAVSAYAERVRTQFLKIPARPLRDVLALYAADRYEEPLGHG